VFENHTRADDRPPSFGVNGRTVVYDPETPDAYVVADAVAPRRRGQ
jgi:hypothetical protein